MDLKLIGLLILVLSSSSSLWGQALNRPAPGQTWSAFLQPFEAESALPTNNDFLRQESVQTLLKTKASPQFLSIHQQLSTLLNTAETYSDNLLTDGSKIQLIDRGLNLPTELVRVSPDGTQQTLLSNQNLAWVSFISADVSPDEKFAIVISETAGSIDTFRLFIVDLTNGNLISQSHLLSNKPPMWIEQHKLAFEHPLVNGSSSTVVDMTSPEVETTTVGTRYAGAIPHVIRCDASGITHIDASGIESPIPGVSCTDKNFFNSSATELIVLKGTDNMRLVKITQDPNTKVWSPSLLFQFQGNVGSPHRFDGYVFIPVSWSVDQSLIILGPGGVFIRQLMLPGYVSIKNVKRGPRPQTLSIKLQSFVAGKTLVYDYLNNVWDEEISENNLMVGANGVQYKTETKMIAARDGVMIPTHITYRLDTPPTNQSAALMEVYGGFAKPGRFYPKLDETTVKMFIDKGGVFVTPAIRGGNELGTQWHQQVVGVNRIIVPHDIIDVADALAQQNLAAPKKIILTGTSNGGQVTAAAGLMSPNSFGMIIPVAGPYDMLALTRTDAAFEGWKQEFGDPNVDAGIQAAMLTESPIELEPDAATLPRYLIVAGFNDSRVNIVNSVKFLKKLRLELPDSDLVHALILKNAGHWIDSAQYEDFISVDEKTVIWTEIYRQLGWTVN